MEVQQVPRIKPLDVLQQHIRLGKVAGTVPDFGGIGEMVVVEGCAMLISSSTLRSMIELERKFLTASRTEYID